MTPIRVPGTHRRPPSLGVLAEALEAREKPGGPVSRASRKPLAATEGAPPRSSTKSLGSQSQAGCGRGDSPLPPRGRGGVGEGAQRPPVHAPPLHPALGRAPSRARAPRRPAPPPCSPRARPAAARLGRRFLPPGRAGTRGFGFQPRARSLLPPPARGPRRAQAGNFAPPAPPPLALQPAPPGAPPGAAPRSLTPLPARPPSPCHLFSISSHDQPPRGSLSRPYPLRLPRVAPVNPGGSCPGLPRPIPSLRPTPSRWAVPTPFLTASHLHFRILPGGSALPHLLLQSCPNSGHHLSCSPFIHRANVYERLPDARHCLGPWEHYREATAKPALEDPTALGGGGVNINSPLPLNQRAGSDHDNTQTGAASSEDRAGPFHKDFFGYFFVLFSSLPHSPRSVPFLPSCVFYAAFSPRGRKVGANSKTGFKRKEAERKKQGSKRIR